MINVLYIGNQLQDKHGIPTTIDTLSTLLCEEGYGVITASKKQNKFARLLDMCRYVFKYRSKVDVVLIDTYSTQNFWYALLVSQICRFVGLRYIPILHGGNLPNRLEKNPKLSRLLFKHAYKLVSPSLFLKERFKVYDYECVYIPNNLELKNYQYGTRVFDKVKLLWVRSFSKIYNPNMAIDVTKQLKDKGFKVELCMVGPEKDGSLENAKSYAKSLDLEISFTGGLSKQEWVELAKDYNVFINTTNFDNMPVSVIEAMALGLPIVSTNVGGLPYLLQHNDTALLVDKGNVSQMTDAIIELKNNKALYQKLSEQGRGKAESYDWNVIKTHWKSLLTS